MADYPQVTITEQHISTDLALFVYSVPAGLLQIHSRNGAVAGTVGVDPTELPALLAALTGAAEAMGVSTVQGEMVAACKAAKALLANLKFYNNIDAVMTEAQCNEYAEIQQQLGQAIAKAEQ